MQNEQNFNPISTPLSQSINLLEASAGTGKTYAIAMLALRFVVEQNLNIEQILIVTFTRAATKELKERVRARLVEAKQFFSGQGTNIDANIALWAEQLIATDEISVETAITRLNNALLSIDQAGIFTIHGFCQRLLKEHALESGQMFDVELSDEVATVRQQMADDFWRAQIYPRNAFEVSLLCHEYATPDALLKSLDNVANALKILPAVEDLDTLLSTIKKRASAAQESLAKQGDALTECVSAGYFKQTYTKRFAESYKQLSHWLNETVAADKHFNCALPSATCFKDFSASTLAKEIYVAKKDQLAFDSALFDALANEITQVSLVLRRFLAQNLQENLDIRLQQLNVMSHDSLITRTAEALSHSGGGLLISAIRQQYRVALIDEFQDTDQTQWHIFSHLFAAKEQSLYLIGDPKQAIYKFRGADIHSYLSAKTQAKQHYTLGHNWRSHPDLVAAINQLFQLNSHPFVFKDLNFNAVKPALSAAHGSLYANDTMLPPLALWQLAESEAKTGYWTSGKAAEELKIAITNEIVQLLTGATQLTIKDKSRALKPADIAILVRTNAHAKLYQDCLKEAGIPAVLNSNESVFKSAQASDLHILMQALAQPSDMALVKQALTLSWFALDGQALHQLLSDQAQLGAWLDRFQDYHLLWQKNGFMAMMLRLFSQENVRVHIAKTQNAERQITNLHHLLELIQQASLDDHLGIHKTVSWLRTAITEENTNDEQQLRLESDADAVKIVTMHRSKGLEYPIVFCPYLWYRRDKLTSEKHLITCHAQGAMIADLGSEQFELHRKMALQEELAEDLRILYVALTRAKYRCYLPWINERSEKKTNQSAFAYLLSGEKAFAEMSFAEQQASLEQLANDYPASFSYQLIAKENVLQGSYQATKTEQNLSAHEQKRHLYSSWQMSSYTALSYLSLHDAPELPLDKAEETSDLTDRTQQEPITLAKGAHTGNVLHDLLENIAFSKLALREDISERRDNTCQRYGLKVEQPEIIDELLYQAVNTPLALDDAQFTLAKLNERSCLKEMPFYLTLADFSTEEINFLLQDSPTYQALSEKQMQGYLTGFIDLIFVHQGRYYVLDYKSNALPDYQPDTLIHAMREHNYGLQYWLYSVVLHLYLQKRLPDYQFEQHFGGVRYLFLRGMQAELAMSGVFSDLPDEELLNALADIFTAAS
ncbi:MAG: exodeoxyribonuclease V subunit beta [Methyloprofundus sp.]|nr:exodeoxyribonuclease V subunit beta [Methyloprofundus sp.]